MKFGLVALFTALLPFGAVAWGAEDHEIFRIRDDVIAHEGPETTFYSFVGVSRKASIDEINKAYRKLASRMHPDKARQKFISSYGKDKDGNPSDSKKKPSEREISAFHKEASARFARLGVVANILRGSQRDRYDFFLDHGFPMWRGTGYYYQRYRPGAGTVLVGLFLVMGGFAHYGAMLLSYNRQRAFAEKYIKDARKRAWGESMVIPGLDTSSSSSAAANGANDANGNSAMNRRQKRLQEKEDKKKAKKGPSITSDDISPPQDAALISGPQGTKRKVTAENGKTLIVDSVGNVFVEETDESGEVHEYFIDVNEIHKPTIQDTVVVRLPIWIWNKTGGRFLGHHADAPQLHESEVDDDGHDNSLGNATANTLSTEARRRKAKVRARP